jgi:hypothetical protein
MTTRILTNACPDCGADMVLRSTKRFTYRDGSPRLFYGCVNWPACRGTHGAHPDGRPLGIPANAETKAARIRAHAAFDPIWQNTKGNKGVARRAAYDWLRRALGLEELPHIGEMSIDGCRLVIRLCEERMQRFPPPPRRYDAWEFIAPEVLYA